MRKWYAIVRTSDRAVMSLDQSYDETDLGALKPDREHVEINKSDWGMISENLQFDMTIPAWECATDGTVTPRFDSRPNLTITLNGTPTDGAPVNIDLSLRDSEGTPMLVNGSRAIRVLNQSGERYVRVTLTNGSVSVSPTLSAGNYSIRSADPSVYRVSGDIDFVVGEAW